MATCAAAREAVIWLCNCKVGEDVACIAVREAIWPVQLWGVLQYGPYRWERGDNMCSCMRKIKKT